MDKICHKIKAERSLGYVLQCKFPEIRTLYKQGLSERAIADLIYDNKPFCSYLSFDGSPRLLEGAVRRALIGNSENDPRNKYGSFYEGLLEGDEYKKYSQRNRQKAARVTTAKNAQNKTGALALSKEDLKKASLDGLKERGLIPWSSSERASAEELSGYGLTHIEIATYLNNFLYSGANIRNKTSVDNALRSSNRNRIGF